MAAWHKAWHFLGEGMWRVRLRDLPPARSVLLRVLRVVVLSLREFSKDKCILRASALTYYTLLAIVPMLAMAFGIAKGFGMEEKLETAIRGKLEWGEESQVDGEVAAILGEGGEDFVRAGQGLAQVADYAIDFANNMLEDVKGGWMAGIGVLLLFWVIIKTLGNIEKSFNDIWGVRKGRSWARKFSDYLAFMVISPVVFVVAGSATGYVVAQGEQLVQRLDMWGWVGDLSLFALRVAPLSLVWLLFAFTYMFMPNTKVKWTSGILGGIVAGTLYQLLQIVYLRFQIGVTRYNAIYGSFAALPFFLVWLQTSWLIVLYGAELAFAQSHVDTYEYEPDCRNVAQSLRRRLMLAVLAMAQRRFEAGRPPQSAEEYADAMGAPIRLTSDVLFELEEAGLLVAVGQDDGPPPAYQPRRELSGMTVAEALDQVEDAGADGLPLGAVDELDRAGQTIVNLRQARRASEANVRLVDL